MSLGAETVTGQGTTDAPWLVALDIDGTTMHEDGTISERVLDQVRRLDAAGHEIMLATGRSAATTLPVLDRLEIAPRFVVCSNGAITLHRDPDSPTGYRREWVETFDPTEVLLSIKSHLTTARYAVEDEHGYYRYTEPFPDATIGLDSEHVDFDDLLRHAATRVVVISPDHDMDDFLRVVDRMGLNRVSYAIGWTAWLDIAPDGVNKATAMERVRAEIGIPRDRVMAVGDGRNDIELLQWAAVHGRGVAMGQAPDEVIAAAGETTGAVQDDGLAFVLSSL
ncbi:Cof subfamily protein (haloacid dehalogenase superfamily) [Cryobacterium sp. MP_M5]|uniref:HAD family hydrolase n=1 Tax=unclassified Cryobacterium TaxID=2649013 RepID=UPI001A28918F|nr:MULTISPECIES: HAD-IIB family hydrolase [unclassified Cryobacterium]MBG6059265.1 Cof subfamily protein (haloacid dehalogenase superfamily) [Cryobacterium sp. MP_M3]MEC5177559.1 Cof subfamily protein (haloacid dehalogenase superfamily) [Cryobacterium sp. MP_M5]